MLGNFSKFNFFYKTKVRLSELQLVNIFLGEKLLGPFKNDSHFNLGYRNGHRNIASRSFHFRKLMQSH